MDTEKTPAPPKSPSRKIIKAGILLFILGIGLGFFADALSFKPRGEGLKVQDSDLKEFFVATGDKLSWLGAGLVMVGAWGVMLRPKED